MTAVNDLLKVLDINSEEQQIKALYELSLIGYFAKWDCGRDGCTYEGRYGSLADIAFRFRNEVKKLPDFVWSKAWHLVVAYVVYGYRWNKEALEHNFEEWQCSEQSYCTPNTNDREIFALYGSKPIHWIIAALIAKELKENKNDTNK